MKVCDKCFNDIEIKQYIISTSKEIGKCDCCSESSSLIDIEELLDFFSSFLSIFAPKENGYSLIKLIQEEWKVFENEKAGLIILQEVFPKMDFPKDEFGNYNSTIKVDYVEEISQCVNYWSILKEDLKTKRRFLTDIHKMDEYQWSNLFNVFAIINSTNMLYRARINQEGKKESYLIEEMGAPKGVVVSAGRANPQGIPYLYLSKEKETTLYETRATYLDLVSIGQFQIDPETEIKIVDFTSCESPFNHMENMIDFTKGRLLRDLISKDLSKPLQRFDSELEYIPTQFICEFIKYNTETNGIQFKSSLDQNGVNIVLFDDENINCVKVELHQVSDIKITSKIL
ncbi:MAG: RES family NAD+ phosphorylase [Paludibacteraceae bacterium]|nr:RES family NAD+ phosphorylase [Paludibacteraceae bacterium]